MPIPAPVEHLYRWRGVNHLGAKVQGLSYASTPQALRLTLAHRRIRATQLHRALGARWFRPKLNGPETALLTRQLAVLLHAGIALPQALELLRHLCTAPRLVLLIDLLIIDVHQGLSLHEALQRSQLCDSWLIHIVKAGESSGRLDQLLAQQASHREQIQAQHAQMRSALAYPLFVLLIALGATAALLGIVVPTFQDVFQSFNAQLPWLTLQILAASAFLQSHGWTVVLGSIAVILLFKTAYQHSSRLKNRIDLHLLQLPWLGALIRQSYLARWCTTMYALTQAAIPLDQALSIVAPAHQNAVFQAACQDLIQRITRGQSLSAALRMHPLCFDTLCIQMCAIGEESGTLTDMLGRLSQHYEQHMQQQVKRIGVLVEPTIMSVLGVLVGGLIAALYLPIFQMGQVL